MRVELLRVQAGWQDPVLQAQHRFDQTRSPSRRLRVPEVGLDRADPKRRARRRVRAIDGSQRLDFDWIEREYFLRSR